MKPAFHEDYSAPGEHLDKRTSDPDWDTIAAMLGEIEEADKSQPDMALLGETLCRLFHWLLDGRRDLEGHARTIGLRTLAMVWVLRPDLIEGTPSQAAIARELEGVAAAGRDTHTTLLERMGEHRPR